LDDLDIDHRRIDITRRINRIISMLEFDENKKRKTGGTDSYSFSSVRLGREISFLCSVGISR